MNIAESRAMRTTEGVLWTRVSIALVAYLAISAAACAADNVSAQEQAKCLLSPALELCHGAILSIHPNAAAINASAQYQARQVLLAQSRSATNIVHADRPPDGIRLNMGGLARTAPGDGQASARALMGAGRMHP